MGWLFGDSSFDKSKSSRCFYNELSGKCGSCAYMNPHNYISGFFGGDKYKCVERGSYYPWNDRVCSRLNEIDPEKVDCVERYRIFTGRKYFILSVICEILNINTDSALYQNIKTLIDLVREDESTVLDAIEYNIVGAQIAYQIANDSDKENLCYYLFKEYLVKTYIFIQKNEEFKAIEIYKEMVKNLFYRYKKLEAESINDCDKCLVR